VLISLNAVLKESATLFEKKQVENKKKIMRNKHPLSLMMSKTMQIPTGIHMD